MCSWIKDSCGCFVIVRQFSCFCIGIFNEVCILHCICYYVTGTESCGMKEKAANCKPVHKDSDHKNPPKHQNKSDKDRHKHHKHKSKHKQNNP